MIRTIVVYDFDGTITRKDSLFLFFTHVLGLWEFSKVLLKNIVWIFAYKVGLYPNWKAKQHLFETAFKGLKYNEFLKLGETFAAKYKEIIRPNAIESIITHLQNGNTVYVVSASMEEWIRPLLNDFPMIRYITTIPEIRNGRLTGLFASRNCYGEEKVKRFIELEPDRNTYFLVVYGDSLGDKELLNIADCANYRVF